MTSIAFTANTRYRVLCACCVHVYAYNFDSTTVGSKTRLTDQPERYSKCGKCGASNNHKYADLLKPSKTATAFRSSAVLAPSYVFQ